MMANFLVKGVREKGDSLITPINFPLYSTPFGVACFWKTANSKCMKISEEEDVFMPQLTVQYDKGDSFFAGCT